MSGRRRRDDGWDEAGSDGQGGARDPWSGSQSQPWAERGSAVGRVRGELPAAGGTAREGAGWSGGADAAGGEWPGSGDWPQANGYQQANGQAGYAGRDQVGYGQGYGEAGGGYGATGQGYDDGGQGYGGAGQGFGTGGYGTQATFTPGGRPAAGPGYTESGHPGSDNSGTGYAGAGYAGTGYAGAGYAGTGYAGAGYPAAGLDAGGYGGQGDSAYGYANGNGDGGYGGYGGADATAGGYRDDGYGQQAYDGSGNAAYDAGLNGGMSPSYQPAQGTGAGPTWHPNGQFQERSATARFGRFESPQAPDLPFGEYAPANGKGPANGTASGTPRPYGRLSIFTLLDDKAAEFDWLAEQASEGVRTSEPDTLVYVIHVVPKAPLQRIIYEIYRDRAAMESHERQPHIKRFVAARKACVLATNIIDLRLKYAKVASLSAPSPAPSPAPYAAPPGDGRYPAQAANGGGWPAEDSTAQYAAPGQDHPRGSDGRVLRSRARDWDQASYQGQRYGGS